MSDLGYFVWFIATALMIITVLTVGTLASAGLLPRRAEPHRQEADDAERAAARATEPEQRRAA